MNTADALQNAIDYIEENLTSSLEYKDICAKAYMSVFQFQRLFTAVCGRTVGEYIRNRRLSAAYIEIASGAANVTDTALKYGYDTPDGFSRAFHRLFGITPSAAMGQRSMAAFTERLSIKELLKGDAAFMEKFLTRGYTVMENGALYYTLDMDKTAKWFENVLGWYVNIDERNAEGVGTYGCALPFPGELKLAGVSEFKGFHLFYGEPSARRSGFILVKGIDKLREFVLDRGWTQITGISEQPWGGRLCTVTSIDGSPITFFEVE